MPGRGAVSCPSASQRQTAVGTPAISSCQLQVNGGSRVVEHHGTRYSKTETEHYAESYNHKIHYNDVGQGPVLFCFHGGGPGSNAWDNSKHNLDALAEHFRCIVMDMPGYGYSDKDVKRG